MNPLERLVAMGGEEARRILANARARVERLARRYPNASPGELVELARRIMARAEPQLAAALEVGTIAAWVQAARGPAREALQSLSPEPPNIIFNREPAPEAPWFAPDASRPPTRYPAVEAAVADLRARRAMLPGDYEQLTADAKRAAFTVARATTTAAVSAVRDAVSDAISEGTGLREFRRRVAPALDDAGLRPDQVETIYRTQVGLAQSAGLRAVLDHPLVGTEFPYVCWYATHDGRTRPDHLAMETAGIQRTNYYRCDDPALTPVWPPAGWNCRCVVVPMSLDQAADAGIEEAKRWRATGVPPDAPAFVGSVPLILPDDWPQTQAGRIRSAV
jgi:hypothetical protein